MPEGSLTLELQRTEEEVHEPEYVLDPPLVRFAAYLPDQRLFGWVRLEAARLTDLLNDCASIRLENVEVADLERGSVRAEEQIVVPRDDLVAVHASGPRGDEARRRTTSTVPVGVWCGNYVISGFLHVPAGQGALENLSERGPMVPPRIKPKPA